MASRSSSPARDLSWLVAIDGAAVLGSFALACMTPFAALAAASALTLSRRAGVMAVLGAWLLNQIIGFGFLGYPTDPMTILRGVAIAVSALAGFGVAHAVRGSAGTLSLARMVAAIAGAFVAYEVVTYLTAMVLGGTENFTPAIVWMLARNDAMWFTGLMALYLALTASAPSVFGRRPQLRLA
ncbi:hypothetical protein [Sphingomonas desiccabilis]|uniref:Energy-coupling factor transport system substrate-specific component n=1 Tax=Sphingomonas desiccabilis TaxID=429134 RepID=A0A4Q2IZK8_9SPHN|nr:hypothetical protein [Sphingomonas desiccabilis]MBB3910104.1 hypothetical protein [Sphingomonas desiccabilis]RXZ34790.1 hypothetical protein EO081_03795 [Sphingomonas desiccabilis]